MKLRNWLEKERERLEAELETLRCGRCKLGKNSGHGWVDITPERIAELSNKISEMNLVLSSLAKKGRLNA
jgi:hypothetical protein